MDEDKGSDVGYDGSDGEWLSYAELATRRDIDRQSAFKLAARHRWRRQKGNTGQVRVFVPSAFAAPEDRSSDNGYDLSHHLAAFETALVAIHEAHAGETAALRDRLTDLQRDLDAARTAALDAQREAQDARQAAEALRLDEAARKASGRWGRLRAAWRGG
jgi:hypothetical protein